MSLRNHTYKDVTKVLKFFGFKPVRQKGSHVIWEHLDDRFIVVPNHGNKPIKEGLLADILLKTEIARNDFLNIISGKKISNNSKKY